MAKKKICSFCGNEYRTDDKSVVLFKTSTDGSDIRICSECVKRCSELYNQKMLKIKQQEIEGTPIDLTPKKIKEMLDEWVLDQDIAMKKIAREYYNHLKRLKRYDLDNEANEKLRIDKSNMIYMGPTGCGKTECIRALASFMNLPYVIEDSSSFTSAGYVGRDVDEILKDLLDAADGDLEKAQKGIVFLDEFDKIRKSSGGKNGKDVSGEAVQQALLRLVEGGTHKVKKDKQTGATMDFNTDNVLFIAGGAFVGLDKIIANRVNKASGKANVGFGAALEKEQEAQYNELITQVKPEDLMEYGMIPEVLGRFPVLVPFKELSVSTLVDILTEPKHAMIKQFKEMYKFESNVDLEFTDEALKLIATKAKEKKIGARGLRSVLEEVLDEVGFEYPSIKGLSKIMITDDLNYRYIIEKSMVASDKKNAIDAEESNPDEE
jgi:ATP-dependent Clp protease ATP-binding subunit ClpX